jgi:cell division GTPase FtsZ
VVFTITGNSDMSLQEVNDVANVISSIVAQDANIIFGTSVDETYGEQPSTAHHMNTTQHTQTREPFL